MFFFLSLLSLIWAQIGRYNMEHDSVPNLKTGFQWWMMQIIWILVIRDIENVFSRLSKIMRWFNIEMVRKAIKFNSSGLSDPKCKNSSKFSFGAKMWIICEWKGQWLSWFYLLVQPDQNESNTIFLRKMLSS